METVLIAIGVLCLLGGIGLLKSGRGGKMSNQGCGAVIVGIILVVIGLLLPNPDDTVDTDSITVTQSSEPTTNVTRPPESTIDVSNCTLGATFQADVTIPDDTEIEAGKSFVKTWRVRNTSTCDWGTGYQFVFVDGNQMSGPDSVDVPETPIGEDVEISVELITPMEEGQYRAHWQICVGASECFGDKLFVQIVSTSP